MHNHIHLLFGEKEREIKGEENVDRLDLESYYKEIGNDPDDLQPRAGFRRPRHVSLTEQGETDEVHERAIRLMESSE